jgi:hypothetical protein
MVGIEEEAEEEPSTKPGLTNRIDNRTRNIISFMRPPSNMEYGNRWENQLQPHQ